MTTQSDASSLEHFLNILLLAEPPSTDASTGMTTPFSARFAKAGIANASYFISMEPDAYGSISFASINKGGNEDLQLNFIQVKEINSLFSWYCSVTFPVIIWWFNLDDPGFQQVWCTLPSTPTQGTMLPSPGGIPTSSSSPSTTSARVSNIASLTTALLRKIRVNVDNIFNLKNAPGATPDEKMPVCNEHICFVFSIFEQKVLTCNYIVFIGVHSHTGDVTGVYSDPMECYSKSTTAQLSASEIEQVLSTFLWSQQYLAETQLVIAWATRFLDLYLLLVQCTTGSQKWT
jgi:hypothetical protein